MVTNSQHVEPWTGRNRAERSDERRGTNMRCGEGEGEGRRVGGGGLHDALQARLVDYSLQGTNVRASSAYVRLLAAAVACEALPMM